MGASRRIIPALRHAATRTLETLETRTCSTLLIVFDCGGNWGFCRL